MKIYSEELYNKKFIRFAAQWGESFAKEQSKECPAVMIVVIVGE